MAISVSICNSDQDKNNQKCLGPVVQKLTTSLVKRFVKISNVNISNMPIFFVEKM